MSIGHNSDRKEDQAKIEADVEAFLSKGGHIEKLEAFQRSSDPTKGYNNRLLQGEGDDKLQPMPTAD